jgi:hypothetical protein
MPNQVHVWNGTAWVAGTPRVFSPAEVLSAAQQSGTATQTSYYAVRGATVTTSGTSAAATVTAASSTTTAQVSWAKTPGATDAFPVTAGANVALKLASVPPGSTCQLHWLTSTGGYLSATGAVTGTATGQAPANAALVRPVLQWAAVPAANPVVLPAASLRIDGWQPYAPAYWDGAAWMTEAPAPVEFPSYVASSQTTYAAANTVTQPLPSVRTNDFVVSLCAQTPGDNPTPRLLSPAGVIPTLYNLASGISLGVAVWPWEPSRGQGVTWDVTGSGTATCMHLVYSGGDISSTSLNPVLSITGKASTTSVALPSSADYTTVYAVLAFSSTLTGVSWPQGVTPRGSAIGTFGSTRISLVTADTPGAGGSAGNLALDTTAEATAVAVIQIPGKSDGSPMWILDDTTGSVLETSTYLG